MEKGNTKDIDFKEVEIRVRGDGSVSSVSSSEYSMGYSANEEVSATIGGNATEGEKSDASPQHSASTTHEPPKYPVWSEIEWDEPTKLQRPPSLPSIDPNQPVRKIQKEFTDIDAAKTKPQEISFHKEKTSDSIISDMSRGSNQMQPAFSQQPDKSKQSGEWVDRVKSGNNLTIA